MALNKSNRTMNAGKNASSAITNKLIFTLLTFISRKFFIQYIGVEYLGINGLFSNVLTLLSMADLGLGTAMNVSLYKPIADHDTKKISALLNYYKKLYHYIALAVLAIGLSLMPFLKYIVNMDQNIPYLYIYYVIFVLKNVISYLFVYKSSIIKADQKTYLVTRIDTYINAAKVVLQIVVIIVFKNYFIYLILDIFKVLAHNITVSVIAGKQYEFINEPTELSTEEKKDMFSNISSIFLYKVSKVLIKGTDNIIMSVLIGTVYVGLYSNYHTITHTLDSFIALLFTSITAGVGNLVATSKPEKIYKTFKTMQMTSFWICSYVCVCLIFLTQDFITLWFGKEYLLDNLTLVAIILDLYFTLCMRPVWTFREGTGMYKRIKYIMFVTAVLNLILSVILGKIFGLSGIIFATSISKLLTYFWYEPFILFKDVFHKNTKTYYIDYAQNVILMMLCAGISFIFISKIDISIIGWILKLIICTLVVNIIYYFKYRNKDEFHNIKSKIYYIINTKLLKKKNTR